MVKKIQGDGCCHIFLPCACALGKLEGRTQTLQHQGERIISFFHFLQHGFGYWKVWSKLMLFNIKVEQIVGNTLTFISLDVEGLKPYKSKVKKWNEEHKPPSLWPASMFTASNETDSSTGARDQRFWKHCCHRLCGEGSWWNLQIICNWTLMW